MPRFDYSFDPNSEIKWDETCRYFTDKVPEKWLLSCDPEVQHIPINYNQVDEDAQRRAGYSAWDDPDHKSSKTINLRARWRMEADDDCALGLLLFKRMMLRPAEGETDDPYLFDVYLSDASAKEMLVLRNVLRHGYKNLRGIEEYDIEAIYQFCKYCPAEKEDNVHDIRLPIIEAIRRGEYNIDLPTDLQGDPSDKSPLPDNSYDFSSLRQSHLRFEKLREEAYEMGDPIFRAPDSSLIEKENAERAEKRRALCERLSHWQID
ncbi:MAG: hypothetical protein OHK93_004723 [Ramalina farinacea]|uniref:Uncharacterized protein n=1 Tax=Ramalina farinacea TaxID=258253 RepID=A0AA43QWE7_9LECA|nr:hypothetical protein [Ramalina farinacea]